MDKHLILGVHLTNRLKQAREVQDLFTTYGCYIKTRLGLHEVEAACQPSGIILLEMHGDEAACLELAEKLQAIAGVDVKNITFDHP